MQTSAPAVAPEPTIVATRINVPSASARRRRNSGRRSVISLPADVRDQAIRWRARGVCAATGSRNVTSQQIASMTAEPIRQAVIPPT
jgi:hypothetical protein